jgi:DNA-binding NtrC family response regulator
LGALVIVEDRILEPIVLASRLPGTASRVSRIGVSDLEQLIGARPSVIVLHSGADQPDEVARCLHRLQRFAPGAPVILVAVHSSEELAITAIKNGVADYFRDPPRGDELAEAVTELLSEEPGRPPCEPAVPPVLVGESRLIAELRLQIARSACCDSNVLITGETGTGKELVAQLIHATGERRRGPFACVNAAAIPDELLESELFGYERGAFTGAYAQRTGKFEAANGGTLFLDEIGDMSHHAQAKILRAIENRSFYRLGGCRSVPVDVRVIAATNRDLEGAVRERTFRADLYHRLNIVRLDLPPLRKRREDIPALLRHFLASFNRIFHTKVRGLSPEVMDLFVSAEWSGNVRELKNVLEAAFVNMPGETITLTDLSPQIRTRLCDTRASPETDKDRLLAALINCNWNKTKVASKLCWSRMTVYRKMARYGIAPREPLAIRPQGLSPARSSAA